MNIEKTITKLDIQHNDVVILKGSWDKDGIESVGQFIGSLDKQCFCIVLPESGSIESIPIREFYNMMKELETRLGIG